MVAPLDSVRSLHGPSVHEDAEAGPHEAAAGGLAALDRDAREAQPGHDVGKYFKRHSEIQTRPEKHVAGDAATAIQVVGRHGAVGYHAPFSRRSLREAQRPWLPRTT